MLANWIGEIVGLMHKYGITSQQLADHLGVTPEYISMILNGHREPVGVEERFRKAIKELLIPAINARFEEQIKDIKSKIANEGKELKNMATKEYGLTDEQVEQEIERLRQSPLVALARREQRIRYRRRQILYQLRDLEKKGKALEKAGITMEVLNSLAELGDYDEV